MRNERNKSARQVFVNYEIRRSEGNSISFMFLYRSFSANFFCLFSTQSTVILDLMVIWRFSVLVTKVKNLRNVEENSILSPEDHIDVYQPTSFHIQELFILHLTFCWYSKIVMVAVLLLKWLILKTCWYMSSLHSFSQWSPYFPDLQIVSRLLLRIKKVCHSEKSAIYFGSTDYPKLHYSEKYEDQKRVQINEVCVSHHLAEGSIF